MLNYPKGKDRIPLPNLSKLLTRDGFNQFKFLFGLKIKKKVGSSSSPAFHVTKQGKYIGTIGADRAMFYPNGSLDMSEYLEGYALLKWIESDPAVWLHVYGVHTGECGMCGRELTDPVSISLGIGPVCAERAGITALERIEVASQDLEKINIAELHTKYRNWLDGAPDYPSNLSTVH